ncbi:MAG: SOS response-associated peptidase [Armatimonadetes bacterium]|nr:SOS response-associated peptidase [Armatimonadota bacterium]MBX3109170.1 SOS response-associated peptidase [Fimbriimonadaceae bacterium]
MCARFVFRNIQAILGQFDAELLPEFPGSTNVAPTDYSLVVRIADRKRRMWPMKWGLIPSWAKDDSSAVKCINARAETVAEKPSFRGAVKYRRCLIPADGFYEWQGVKGYKQPYFIHRADGEMMAMAGIWEEWEGPQGTVETFSVLTTDANREMSDIHTRMPVILEPRDFDRWLDPSLTDVEAFRSVLQPAADGTLVMHPVGKAVGNPRAEGPELMDPVAGGTLF